MSTTSYDDGQLQLGVPDGDILELDENFTDFEIQSRDGSWTAADDHFKLIVTGGKICHRRAYQPILNKRRSALLAELDGVKLYIRWTGTGYQALLTKQDLRI